MQETCARNRKYNFEVWLLAMKALVQRVTSASVTGMSIWESFYIIIIFIIVDGKVISCIGKGVCVLLGISRKDTPQELEWTYVNLCGCH